MTVERRESGIGAPPADELWRWYGQHAARIEVWVRGASEADLAAVGAG